MSSSRISRAWITATLSRMTPLEAKTLDLFTHHKKWTAPLLAIKEQVDLSTAHRRLGPLIDLGLIDRQCSGYRSTGGRFPDLFYLTAQGAAVLNRVLDQGEHQVKAPSIANPVSNEHDLLVLELALRLDCWDRLDHRKKLTLDVYHASDRDEFDQEMTGGQISLVPDLHLSDRVSRHEHYFEVEQTTRYRHILGKYQTYKQVDRYHCAQGTDSFLWVIFADLRQRWTLMPDHRRAHKQVNMGDANVLVADMDAVRAAHVQDLYGLWSLVEYI
ncbi:MAG: replication-relaxation family protein [Anaerolineae bacterium]|nr:replication-relaxation family protein [Anaerolineae bacterium]